MNALPSPKRHQPKSAKPAATRSARQFPWTHDEDALLGTITDRELAEKLNRTLGCVRGRRRFLGKAAVGRAPHALHAEREPPDSYARLFATKSDRELRSLLGWSYHQIQNRRRRLTNGNPKKFSREWSIEEDRLLGTKPDEVLARKFGRPVSTVRTRRWTKRIRLHLKKWLPEDDKIVGSRPDRDVALLLGRNVRSVAFRRRKLGLPPKTTWRRWTPEEEALLGSKPDEDLAREFGRTVVAVEARRHIFGRAKPNTAFKIIKVLAPRPRRKPSSTTVHAKRRASYCTWTAEEDALLGNLPDVEVARKLGYSLARVRRRRHLLRRSNPNPHRRNWTKEEVALIGTLPDREVGLLVNRSLANVRDKRLALDIPFCNPDYEIWKPEDLALLGKLPDQEVARRTGHPLAKVRSARTKRHILSVRRAGPGWLPEEESLLGTKPDAEIAARLKRSVGAVRLRRFNKGIPRWRASAA